MRFLAPKNCYPNSQQELKWLKPRAAARVSVPAGLEGRSWISPARAGGILSDRVEYQCLISQPEILTDFRFDTYIFVYGAYWLAVAWWPVATFNIIN